MSAMSAEFTAQMTQFLQSKGLKFDASGNIDTSQFAASAVGLDRLVRKEDSLGAIRELKPPTDHIGLSLVPFLEVGSDDVIFDYIKGGLTDGLTPARAEDAESELSQKDDLTYGQGRASIIDWAEKDKYTASDVTRYNENRRLAQLAQGAGVQLQLNDPGNAVAQFQAQVARDDARRSRKIYNRLEWLIQQALWTGGITYNDGKIKFTVDYARPVGQQDVVPTTLFDAGAAHDPIGYLLDLDKAHYDTYGVHLRRAITSRKVLQTFWKSDRWIARTGMVVGGTPSSPIDPRYIMESWSPEYAIAAVEQATGIRFIEYDSVYRTRAWGTTTMVNTRFSPENKILFLPDESDLGEIDDTLVGFGKTLTSPHPEGNFTSGFYEWENSTIDPWMHWRGTGVKAFPVLPYLEYSVVARVLA
jgi:hypothetical protein